MTHVLEPAAMTSALPDPTVTPLMRPDDFARIAPFGKSTVYAAIEDGDIPSIRIRGRIYVPVGELRRVWGVDPLPASGEALTTVDGVA